MHEASLHDANCFVTLTYSDEHLPSDGSLHKPHFQAFMKRLRAQLGHRISYLHCGEYGDDNGRPHYHALLFGYRPPDLRFFKRSYSGEDLYVSDKLDATWALGHCWVGELTLQSAAYVARYSLKKVTGERAADHYRRINEDGEIIYLQPEYVTMSTRPAVGERWFQKFKSDAFPSDFLVHDGQKYPVPRYYTKLLERENRKMYRRVKLERILDAANPKQRAENSTARLRVREECKTARMGRKVRSL